MTAPRDLSAMWDDGVCVVCGSISFASYAHVETHLADGTAVVEMAYGKVDRVVPTSSLPIKDSGDDPTVYPKKLPRGAKSVYLKSFRS